MVIDDLFEKTQEEISEAISLDFRNIVGLVFSLLNDLTEENKKAIIRIYNSCNPSKTSEHLLASSIRLKLINLDNYRLLFDLDPSRIEQFIDCAPHEALMHGVESIERHRESPQKRQAYEELVERATDYFAKQTNNPEQIYIAYCNLTEGLPVTSGVISTLIQKIEDIYDLGNFGDIYVHALEMNDTETLTTLTKNISRYPEEVSEEVVQRLVAVYKEYKLEGVIKVLEDTWNDDLAFLLDKDLALEVLFDDDPEENIEQISDVYNESTYHRGIAAKAIMETLIQYEDYEIAIEVEPSMMENFVEARPSDALIYGVERIIRYEDTAKEDFYKELIDKALDQLIEYGEDKQICQVYYGLTKILLPTSEVVRDLIGRIEDIHENEYFGLMYMRALEINDTDTLSKMANDLSKEDMNEAIGIAIDAGDINLIRSLDGDIQQKSPEVPQYFGVLSLAKSIIQNVQENFSTINFPQNIHTSRFEGNYGTIVYLKQQGRI